MNADSPPASPVYLPELWAERESFRYQLKAPLIKAEAQFEFKKTSLSTAELSLRSVARIPLRGEFRFEAVTAFAARHQGSVLEFSFLEEVDPLRHWRRTTRREANAVRIDTFRSERQSRSERFVLPEVETLNSLTALIALRASLGGAGNAHRLLVLASQRLYRVHLRRSSTQSNPPSGAWWIVEAVPLQDADGSQMLKDDSERRQISVLWSQQHGLPQELNIKVPILGALKLELIDHAR